MQRKVNRKTEISIIIDIIIIIITLLLMHIKPFIKQRISAEQVQGEKLVQGRSSVIRVRFEFTFPSCVVRIIYKGKNYYNLL